MNIRVASQLACSVLVVACLVGIASAQSYPARTVRIIDAYPPGGASDYLARTIASKLTDSLGQSVIVENRPGAGGNLGAELAAHSPPDGYTLFLGLSSALAPSATLYPKLRYSITKDFVPVSRVGEGAYAFVSNPSLPAKTVKDLIALAKSKPGELNYASAGMGSGPNLCGELFKSKAGVNLVHVPYKGGAPSVAAVISGEAHLGFMSVASALSHIRAGKVRALGVTTPQRVAALPDVPTITEAGVPGYEVVPTFGMYAPTRTPGAVVNRLNDELRNILETPDVREQFASRGVEAKSSSSEELSRIVAAEIALWAKVIKDAGIKVN